MRGKSIVRRLAAMRLVGSEPLSGFRSLRNWMFALPGSGPAARWADGALIEPCAMRGLGKREVWVERFSGPFSNLAEGRRGLRGRGRLKSLRRECDGMRERNGARLASGDRGLRVLDRLWGVVRG